MLIVPPVQFLSPHRFVIRLVIIVVAINVVFVIIWNPSLLSSLQLSRAAININDTATVVVLWNTFYGNSVTEYFTDDKIRKCTHRCIFTRNRSMADKSAAIIFHAHDFDPNDIPPRRDAEQIWVLLGMESALHTPKTVLALNGRINWTITHRSDADIPYPKFRTLKLSSVIERLAHRAVPKRFKKKRMAAWFASNCHAPSGRSEFVRELQKVIDVDVYGACGHLRCVPAYSHECYEMLSKKYYFYLSFENSLCRDYVTEKFYYPINYDVVPVVMGSANYSAFSPPRSFIDALSFVTPQELGRYMKNIVHTWKNYSSFFKWKGDYTVAEEEQQAACRLCEKIQSHNYSTKVYVDIKKWWFDDPKCWTWKPRGDRGFGVGDERN
ncbi:alpha-(1,3)-fucosyltransferase C-like [Ornithodoros turicata]|uniref:alpha-(1,3)-fucosyltransferase C-like n=1 Tax=Ornithodoros turicata TaxID=34597 RepID=UPI003138FA46